AVRAGYYYDKTPQPIADVGPILPDSNRNGYTFGFGYNTDTWGVDVGDVYLVFKKRDATGPNTDNFHGTYKETANIGSINFRYRFERQGERSHEKHHRARGVGRPGRRSPGRLPRRTGNHGAQVRGRGGQLRRRLRRRLPGDAGAEILLLQPDRDVVWHL